MFSIWTLQVAVGLQYRMQSIQSEPLLYEKCTPSNLISLQMYTLGEVLSKGHFSCAGTLEETAGKHCPTVIS